MRKTFIGVRGVDEETFRKFRALTIEERMRLGDALTMAMRHWVEEERAKGITKPDPRNLLKIKGIVTTKKKVKWSEEIDKFLYGLEK